MGTKIAREDPERERERAKLQRSRCLRNLDNVKDSRGADSRGRVETLW